MSKGFYQMPYPENEEVRSYEPSSKELESLINISMKSMYHQKPIHIPLYIGSNDEVNNQTNNFQSIPRMITNTSLGEFSVGDASPC